jgi:CRP-like cAMP-binding protein
MEQIRAYFEKNLLLSEYDWDYFSSKLSKKEFRKNELLLKNGQTENHLSFIETGIVRYFLPKGEHELTFAFGFENSFVSGYDSFLVQQPSTYYIQTLKKTVLWQLTYKDLQNIYQETIIGNKIGRLASEELFLKKSKREISLLVDTAERRYLNLFHEQPQLIEKIPLKYIASYIGITPQALSRIRKRIS